MTPVWAERKPTRVCFTYLRSLRKLQVKSPFLISEISDRNPGSAPASGNWARQSVLTGLLSQTRARFTVKWRTHFAPAAVLHPKIFLFCSVQKEVSRAPLGKIELGSRGSFWTLTKIVDPHRLLSPDCPCGLCAHEIRLKWVMHIKQWQRLVNLISVIRVHRPLAARYIYSQHLHSASLCAVSLCGVCRCNCSQPRSTWI